MSEFTRREVLVRAANLIHTINLLCYKTKSFWSPLFYTPGSYATPYSLSGAPPQSYDPLLSQLVET